MDRERLDAWVEGYRRAWEQADTPAAVALFTEDATYRSHPLQPAHTGHDGIAAYWSQVTADQRDVQVRFGEPVVAGERVAVEWWTTMASGGGPVTLAGVLVLAFAGDGRCRALRESWNLTTGRVDPPAGWGRLGGDGGGRAAEHARRWAGGYERAWRAGDASAAAALFAPGAVYRTQPFRAPAEGREGVLAYTRDAYAAESGQDPRFGDPVAAGSSAAVEYWATMAEDGRPVTLVGTAMLDFDPDGLVAAGRDYWHLEPGTHRPYEGWGG